LHLCTDVTTTESNLRGCGPCRALFRTRDFRLARRRLRHLRPFGEKTRCDLIRYPATPQLLHQCSIATLPRAVTRLDQRASEPFVVNDADRLKAIRCGDHVLFWISRGDESLDERTLTPWGARERTRSGL
jgi:hypothetical protein